MLSTSVEQVVACVLVTQRARVRSPVGTSFLGEVFRGFYSPVRQMSGSFMPQGPRISFGHHYPLQSFITGANDLRCWRALKPQIYIYKVHFLNNNVKFSNENLFQIWVQLSIFLEVFYFYLFIYLFIFYFNFRALLWDVMGMTVSQLHDQGEI